MTRLPGHMSLQEMGFYSGATAVEILGNLDAQGRKIKFLALIFDVPYMILQALVFEAAIAFGILKMRLTASYWQGLFILPILFLLADAFEDSSLALLLSTEQMIFGTFAGIFTAIKFCAFTPAIIISLIMVGGGFFAIIKRKASH
jgi:hypothetical protein